MSTSPDPATTGRLIVRASDESIGLSRRRILVIDSHLALVQFAFGRLDCAIPAGLYRVRVESDCDPYEEPVVILPGRSVELEYPNTQAHLLCSPAPVPGTNSGRARFREPLAQLMARHQAGGERIYLMVTPRAGEDRAGPVSLQGWSVLVGGTEETQLAEAETETDAAGQWTIATVPVRPGGHLLQWTDAKREVIQQSLWLPAGWVMLVFLGRAAGVDAPDPESLSVHLSPIGRDFVQEERGGQLEAALKSLREGRMYLPDEEVEAELLGGKFDDPWLGIVLTHLVLQRKKTEVPVAVLEHLDALAAGHPDVAALRVQTAVGQGAPVEWPPMIQRGLAALRAADWADDAIEGGTLADAIRCQTLAGTFWTRWPAAARGRRRRVRSSRRRQKGISAAGMLTDWKQGLDEVALSALKSVGSSKRAYAAGRVPAPAKALVSQLKNYLELYQTINGRAPDAQALAWAGLKEKQVIRLLRLGQAVRGRPSRAKAAKPDPQAGAVEEGKITPTPVLASLVGAEPVTREELKAKLREYLLKRGVEQRRAARAASLLKQALGQTPLNKTDLEAFIRRKEWRTEENA